MEPEQHTVLCLQIYKSMCEETSLPPPRFRTYQAKQALVLASYCSNLVYPNNMLGVQLFVPVSSYVLVAESEGIK